MHDGVRAQHNAAHSLQFVADMWSRSPWASTLEPLRKDREFELLPPHVAPVGSTVVLRGYDVSTLMFGVYRSVR